jgi:RNA polymerase sigma-70 factor (ECF subfamily)
MPVSPSELRPEALYRLYASRIGRRVRAALGSDFDHEDIVHEVLITVFRRIGTLRDPLCLPAWIDQVTLNTVRYAVRQRRLRRHASWEDLPERQAGSFQPNLDARDLATRAIGVIERLPPNERALLLNYWFSSLSARELAKHSGCSVVTVSRRLHRARDRFERLARHDPALARCVEEALVDSPKWRRAAKTRRQRSDVRANFAQSEVS